MTGEADDRTIDAFHDSRFALVQPRKGAHRAGMDALLLASVVPTRFSGDVADFGAGAGAVGFAVACRCTAARAVLIERSPEMVSCAQASVALPANAAFADRIRLIEADLVDGTARIAAGFAERSADFILMNPPFNDSRDRASPDVLRRQAHVAEETIFEDWIRSAAAIARPRAGVAIIARPASIAAILTALSGRFGGAAIVPIHAFAAKPAIRIVVRATMGSRAATTIFPPFVLHEEDRNFTVQARAINAGAASLFGD